MKEKKDCIMDLLDKIQETVDQVMKRFDGDIEELRKLRIESEKEMLTSNSTPKDKP